MYASLCVNPCVCTVPLAGAAALPGPDPPAPASAPVPPPFNGSRGPFSPPGGAVRSFLYVPKRIFPLFLRVVFYLRRSCAEFGAGGKTLEPLSCFPGWESGETGE